MVAYGTGSSRMKQGDAQNGLYRPLVETFKLALTCGYRRLDAAEIYGTEAELGVAIAESKICRSELFISSKVFDPSKDIRASLAKSLELLQTDYVDLYMIHQPFTSPNNATLQAAWATMEALHSEGKAKSIGVSNFSQAQVEMLLEKANVRPTVNQTEYHPYLQRPGLKPFLDSNGIKLEAYGPLTPIIDGQGRPGPLDETLAALSKKYSVGEAEILLAWCVGQGVTPVITTEKKDRMVSALKASNVKLTQDDIRQISEKGEAKNFRRWWANFYPENDFN